MQVHVGGVGGEVAVASRRPTADMAVLGSWATARGAELTDLALTRASLEDVYLQLTGGADGD